MILSINHISVHVGNLDESSNFYENVLQLPPVHRPDLGFAGKWFKVGSYQELHLIADLKGVVNSASRGNHFAFEVRDIIKVEQYLLSISYSHRKPKQRADGAWQIFLQDPDGYYIELYQPC